VERAITFQKISLRKRKREMPTTITTTTTTKTGKKKKERRDGRGRKGREKKERARENGVQRKNCQSQHRRNEKKNEKRTFSVSG